MSRAEGEKMGYPGLNSQERIDDQTKKRGGVSSSGTFAPSGMDTPTELRPDTDGNGQKEKSENEVTMDEDDEDATQTSVQSA